MDWYEEMADRSISAEAFRLVTETSFEGALFNPLRP